MHVYLAISHAYYLGLTFDKPLDFAKQESAFPKKYNSSQSLSYTTSKGCWQIVIAFSIDVIL